jgi:protein-tyrosine phosphatase
MINYKFELGIIILIILFIIINYANQVNTKNMLYYRYFNEINNIIDTNLYISNYDMAKLASFNNIKVVINVCNTNHSIDTKKLWLENNIQYYYLPLNDDLNQDISHVANQVNEIIINNTNNNILIHCHAGISRSAAVIIYHLLKSGKFKTYKKALEYVRISRPIIQPNEGFEKQLIQI